MKDKIKENAVYIVAVVGIVIALWAVFALIVAFVNVQNQMNWCQYKDGQTYWTSSKQENTGKRWSPNPLTIGLTGQCIDPGDKGL